MAIRKGQSKDAAAISTLAFRSKAYWGYDEAFMQACKQELRYTGAQIESQEWQFWLVVESKERDTEHIHGFAAVEFVSPTTAELHALFVQPEHINTGTGSLLLAKVSEEAMLAGANEVLVHSDPNAEAFYQKMGFATISRAPSGSIAGRTLPLMFKRLDQL